jgi:uncharacterized damage-inducible protein DinB
MHRHSRSTGAGSTDAVDRERLDKTGVMVDQKPPQFVADELTTVHDLLQFQRESLARKVTGVSEADARQSPVQSGTSLLWLMKHISRAERIWIMGRFSGRDTGVPDGAIGPEDTLAAAVDFYRLTWREVDAIVYQASGLDEPALLSPSGSPAVNLRWILMHLLEETARHAGHADILRELLDGSTGR